MLRFISIFIPLPRHVRLSKRFSWCICMRLAQNAECWVCWVGANCLTSMCVSPKKKTKQQKNKYVLEWKNILWRRCKKRINLQFKETVEYMKIQAEFNIQFPMNNQLILRRQTFLWRTLVSAGWKCLWNSALTNVGWTYTWLNNNRCSGVLQANNPIYVSCHVVCDFSDWELMMMVMMTITLSVLVRSGECE